MYTMRIVAKLLPVRGFLERAVLISVRKGVGRRRREAVVPLCRIRLISLMAQTLGFVLRL